jgi:hypothetical protein
MGLVFPGKTHDIVRKYRAQQATLKAGGSLAEGEVAVTKGEVSDALARPALGIALTTVFSALAAAGMMTGSGPGDRDENKAKRATGWQPYSFKIGGVYIPYNRFEPVASLLMLVADAFEGGDEKGLTTKVVASMAGAFSAKSFWNSLNQVASAITDPTRSAKGTLASYAASFAVPAIVAKAAEAADPIWRERRSAAALGGTGEAMTRGIGRRIPFYSSGMEPMYDPFGRPVARHGNAVTRFALPVQPSREKPGTELEAYLVKIHEAPRGVPTEVSIPKALLPRSGDRDLTGTRIQLNNDERAILAEARREATMRLRSQLSTLKTAPVEDQRHRVRSIFNKADKRAIERLWATSKGLRDRAKQKVAEQG